MQEKQKVIYSVIVFAALILIAAAIYFLLIRDKGPEPVEEEIVTEERVFLDTSISEILEKVKNRKAD